MEKRAFLLDFGGHMTVSHRCMPASRTESAGRPSATAVRQLDFQPLFGFWESGPVTGGGHAAVSCKDEERKPVWTSGTAR